MSVLGREVVILVEAEFRGSGRVFKSLQCSTQDFLINGILKGQERNSNQNGRRAVYGLTNLRLYVILRQI